MENKKTYRSPDKSGRSHSHPYGHRHPKGHQHTHPHPHSPGQSSGNSHGSHLHNVSRKGGHSHGHLQAPLVIDAGKAFVIGITLNLVFVAAEFFAGFHYDSMALISDAGHNLSDVVSLLLALFAYRLAKVKANDRYTFGYRKSTILVSLLNALILLVVVGGIIRESIEKIGDPQPVEGGAIAWVAGIGVVVNGITALMFIREKNRDLNVKGAYIHMLADAMVSVGVLVSGLVIAGTGWNLLDPIIGIVVAVAILFSTWGVLRESLRLSLDGVPVGIDREKVRGIITDTRGVEGTHHIHIWAISTTENALTAHVVTDGSRLETDLKKEIKERLTGYGIGHTTLEFETAGESCPECENDEDGA